MLDVSHVVQAYADRWKGQRAKNAPRGEHWRATEGDADALRDVLLGVLDVLEGLRPWSDLRRMHVVIERSDRGTRERRQNVVAAIAHRLQVSRLTRKPLDLKGAEELILRMKEENPKFGSLKAKDVVDEFAARRGRAGAIDIAGKLSARCNAFGDNSAEDPADNYRKAMRALRQK